MYENWKWNFGSFWGWFDLVFGGFDREKRGFEFLEMCNSVQLRGGEGKRADIGTIVVQKFPVGVFVNFLTALERFGECWVRVDPCVGAGHRPA